MSSALPPVALAAFEGPLDLLLHLIREHKVEIADIPIVEITDHYLAWLRAMEALNLAVAGEFLVMAATLLEIKSRSLLPRPPKEDVSEGEEGEDPRQELVRKLLDYQRYKAFTDTLAGWEDEHRRLFFREPTGLELYELPIAFGAFSPHSLIQALTRLLAEAGEDDAQTVTSVRRRKLTLRFAMLVLARKVEAAREDGITFEDCFARPLVRADIVMTFLALLELLRQGRLCAEQHTMLGEIWLFPGRSGAPTAGDKDVETE